jgi:Raf kinase inhibitor-like YbhB/YbcL family protein
MRNERAVRTHFILAASLIAASTLAVPGRAVAQERMQLDSSAFEHNEPSPARYTCEGEDISVPLTWSHLPAGTETLVLMVHDPDVPSPSQPRKQWNHWLLYDIPASATELAEGAATKLPEGTREGLNGWGRTGWGGPCPPIGTHRYYFYLYALDSTLGDIATPSKRELLAAMEGHVIGRAELMGTYRKREQPEAAVEP